MGANIEPKGSTPGDKASSLRRVLASVVAVLLAMFLSSGTLASQSVGASVPMVSPDQLELSWSEAICNVAGNGEITLTAKNGFSTLRADSYSTAEPGKILFSSDGNNDEVVGAILEEDLQRLVQVAPTARIYWKAYVFYGNQWVFLENSPQYPVTICEKSSAEPTATAATEDADYGQSNGTATITVTNTADKTDDSVVYSVTLNGVTKQTGAVADGQSGAVSFTQLEAGTYSVSVKGDDGTTTSLTVTVKEKSPPSDQEVPVPATPEVNDPCGVNNASWVKPADSAQVSWVVRSDGHLIATANEGYVFSDGTKSHDYGVAKDAGTPCQPEPAEPTGSIGDPVCQDGKGSVRLAFGNTGGSSTSLTWSVDGAMSNVEVPVAAGQTVYRTISLSAGRHDVAIWVYGTEAAKPVASRSVTVQCSTTPPVVVEPTVTVTLDACKPGDTQARGQLTVDNSASSRDVQLMLRVDNEDAAQGPLTVKAGQKLTQAIAISFGKAEIVNVASGKVLWSADVKGCGSSPSPTDTPTPTSTGGPTSTATNSPSPSSTPSGTGEPTDPSGTSTNSSSTSSSESSVGGGSSSSNGSNSSSTGNGADSGSSSKDGKPTGPSVQTGYVDEGSNTRTVIGLGGLLFVLVVLAGYLTTRLREE